MRLAPITPFIRIGDGPHCVGDGHAMWEEAARLNLLDVAGAVRRIVPSGVSRGGGASTPAPG